MRSDQGFKSITSLASKSIGVMGFNNSAVDIYGTVGECPIDKRAYEGYCTQCNILVCPQCAMFGEHRGHNLCTMEQASKFLRNQMDAAAKNGSLKMEKTETVLVDIRHTKLSCEEAQQKIVKEVETTFQQIFKLIKQRKDDVLNEVNQHFAEQLALINEQDIKWMDKQERALKLIELAKQPNDYQILEKAPYIVQSLDILSQSPQYHSLQIVNSIDTNLVAVSGSQPQNSITLNLNEIKKALEKWVNLGEQLLIQFKC